MTIPGFKSQLGDRPSNSDPWAAAQVCMARPVVNLCELVTWVEAGCSLTLLSCCWSRSSGES